MVVIGNRIYVAGGTGSDATEREVEVYDPIANTWRPLAPMNVGRNHCAGGTIGGQFYPETMRARSAAEKFGADRAL